MPGRVSYDPPQVVALAFVVRQADGRTVIVGSRQVIRAELEQGMSTERMDERLGLKGQTFEIRASCASVVIQQTEQRTEPPALTQPGLWLPGMHWRALPPPEGGA